MRKPLQNSVHFLVYTNIWVALCLSVLVLGVAKHYNITDCFLFATFAFLGTFSTYNFHRLIRNIQFEKIHLVTERIMWQNKYRIILLFFSLLSAIAAAIIFLWLPVKPLSVLLLGISGIIIFFYAIPVLGFTMLRSIPFIKNLLILMVWIILICVPLINREKQIDFLEITATALFIFAQIIPFDIRDLPYDSAGMKTIPQVMGIRNSKILATFLTLSACGILIVGAHCSTPQQFFLITPLLISTFSLWTKSTSANSTLLEVFWDGSLMLLGIYFFLV